MSSVESNIKKLYKQRIDLLVSTEWWLNRNVIQAGYNPDNLELAFIFMELDLYMAFSKNTPNEIVDQVSSTFETLKEDGLLQRLEVKYRQKYK